MKQIVALWLVGSLLVAHPATAVVLIGFGNTNPSLHDDFSSNTTGNYTNVSGIFAVNTADGNAYGATAWTSHIAYNNFSISRANQQVEASVTYNGITDSAGIYFRVNNSGSPVTGYGARFTGTGKVVLYSLSGSTYTFISEYNGAYVSGTYALKATISGTTIKVYVNGIERISTTSSTYTSGDRCGLLFMRSYENFDARADNLTCISL